MKKHFLSFWGGVAFSALLFTLPISALAASGKLTLAVDPINIMVDGSVFAPTDVNGNTVPVFAYNGTTYAPLRALAEAFGLNVGYDAAANMATVTDPSKQTATAPEANVWEIKTYVDEFNEKTDDWYIVPRRLLDGTFSNSAATNADLKAKIMYDVYDDISIFLYEYGSMQVKNYGNSSRDYAITVRGGGRELTAYGSIYPLDDRIFLDKADVPFLTELLMGTGTVSFYIEELDPPGIPTTYLFSVESGDFAAEYRAAKAGQ